MSKVILITGATDGIGFAVAKKLVSLGHKLLIHGRNPEKLEKVCSELLSIRASSVIGKYISDLSDLKSVDKMAVSILAEHKQLDAIINNAGIFKTENPITKDELDIRYVVNVFAPYHLSHKLLSLLPSNGRIINVSSAAQATVNLDALKGREPLDDYEAYAQSKLAITMWSSHLANSLGSDGPQVISVNPGSLLASKMVKEGFGMEGKDINIGADILASLAVEDKYKESTGKYFDNDAGVFAPPHSDGLDSEKVKRVVEAIGETVKGLL
jgi:NAD(P)-dependent dehydrogenase (short-subunit alcohol dehydrogenase family)